MTMSKGNPTAIMSTASEALDAVLTRLLGVDSSINIAEPAPLDIEQAVQQSAAFVTLTADTENGDRWAVLLDPSWVPVLSQSVLGEPSEVGDPGADDLLKELAAQAYEAVRTRYASRSITVGRAGSDKSGETGAGDSGELAVGSADTGAAGSAADDLDAASVKASGEPAADHSGSPTGAVGGAADGADTADGSLPEITIRLLPGGSTLEPGDFSSDMVQVSFVLPHADQQLSGLALLPPPPTSASQVGVDGPSASQSAETGVQPADAPRTPSGATPASSAAQTVGGTYPAHPGSPIIEPAGGHFPGSAQAPKSSNPAGTDRVRVSPAAFPDLGSEIVGGDGSNAGFSLLAEVDLEVTVELGRRKIQLADVLRLTTGSVIELEKLVGEPLEVYANGRLIAEGEAVVMDEQFGIRITNLTANRTRSRAFS